MAKKGMRRMVDTPIEMPQANRRQRDWYGVIVSLAALCTSVVSIIVAVSNSQSMERLVQANSWPYLQFDSGNGPGEDGVLRVDVRLSNAGTGPLRIENFVVRYDGEDRRDLLALLDACCVEDATQIASADEFVEVLGDDVGTYTPTGNVLAPGGEVLVYRYGLTEGRDAIWEGLNQTRFDAEFRACFCSVFDECWTTDFVDRPTKVAVCPVEEDYWRG